MPYNVAAEYDDGTTMFQRYDSNVEASTDYEKTVATAKFFERFNPGNIVRVVLVHVLAPSQPARHRADRALVVEEYRPVHA